MQKMRMAILSLLVVALVALPGCSPGGTWFPKGSARVHKESYGSRTPTRSDPGRGGPWGGPEMGSVSRSRR